MFSVSQPGDRAERDAKRLAGDSAAGKSLPGRNYGAAATTSPVGVPAGVPADVAEALRTSGMPLGMKVRTKMERRFGVDLSAVRMVADSNAARSAETLQAQAYTLGQKIVFGRGQYSPDTSAGEQLIAHELAHVMQQQSANAAGSPVICRQEKVNTEVDDIIVWHYINEAMKNNDGSIQGALDEIITKRLSDPMDPNLAAADHYLFSQLLVTYTPIPSFGVAYMAMGYGMVKDNLQDMGLDNLLSFSDEPTTPNSVAQTEWGMRGAFEAGLTYELYNYLFEDED